MVLLKSIERRRGEWCRIIFFNEMFNLGVKLLKFRNFFKEVNENSRFLKVKFKI